jgi:hypothetical protein
MYIKINALKMVIYDSITNQLPKVSYNVKKTFSKKTHWTTCWVYGLLPVTCMITAIIYKGDQSPWDDETTNAIILYLSKQYLYWKVRCTNIFHSFSVARSNRLNRQCKCDLYKGFVNRINWIRDGRILFHSHMSITRVYMHSMREKRNNTSI